MKFSIILIIFVFTFLIDQSLCVQCEIGGWKADCIKNAYIFRNKDYIVHFNNTKVDIPFNTHLVFEGDVVFNSSSTINFRCSNSNLNCTQLYFNGNNIVFNPSSIQVDLDLNNHLKALNNNNTFDQQQLLNNLYFLKLNSKSSLIVPDESWIGYYSTNFNYSLTIINNGTNSNYFSCSYESKYSYSLDNNQKQIGLEIDCRNNVKASDIIEINIKNVLCSRIEEILQQNVTFSLKTYIESLVEKFYQKSYILNSGYYKFNLSNTNSTPTGVYMKFYPTFNYQNKSAIQEMITSLSSLVDYCKPDDISLFKKDLDISIESKKQVQDLNTVTPTFPPSEYFEEVPTKDKEPQQPPLPKSSSDVSSSSRLTGGADITLSKIIFTIITVIAFSIVVLL
ncbi:hypothetical protein CYY_009233 [Polysphondylium violaceum]|uniref:Uncharacterized protein n=1 Tax=Polysphondylium violaceum TaxID=133409 RepID=A0A8J4UPN0_9MYCE|nr:hypothetical protein CYY_009233 [Polysphondylium violaceum]